MELWEYDLPTIGVICRHIRSSWTNKKPVDIAKVCPFDDGIISRFENGVSQMRKSYFNCYLDTVESLCPRRFTTQQRDILDSLYSHSKERKKRQDELAAIDLEFIKSNSRPANLKRLVNDLENDDYPAFIMDPLWHIHAVNGPLLRLFSIEPDSILLNRWWFWQVLATKFLPDSPVRKAHQDQKVYFRHAVEQYFQNRFTNRFLFTAQMRHLLHQINEFSEPNKFKFATWWHGAFTFSGDEYKVNPFRRILWYKDDRGQEKTIKAESVTREAMEVELAPGFYAFYIMLTWYPYEDEAIMAFNEIRRSPLKGVKSFFAADFDDGSFHVNTWPEVVAEIPILQS